MLAFQFFLDHHVLIYLFLFLLDALKSADLQWGTSEACYGPSACGPIPPIPRGSIQLCRGPPMELVMDFWARVEEIVGILWAS